MNHTLSTKSIGWCGFLLLANQLLVHQPLRAQDAVSRAARSALVKTNVAGPFSLFLEIPVVPRRSIQLSTQWTTFSLFSTTHFFSLTADYRFYTGKIVPTPLRPSPKGFYWGPYVKYRTVADEKKGNSSGNTYSTVTYSMIGGGAMVGKQFINRWGLTIDAFFGIGYFPIISSQITVDIPTPRPPEPQPHDYQLDIRPGICIGLAF